MITQITHTRIFFTLFQINDLPFLTKKTTNTGDGFDNNGNDNNDNRWNKFPYTLRYAVIPVFIALVMLKILFFFNNATEKSLLQTLKQKAYQGLTAQEHKDLF